MDSLIHREAVEKYANFYSNGSLVFHKRLKDSVVEFSQEKVKRVHTMLRA